jgi:hypothetical protein
MPDPIVSKNILNAICLADIECTSASIGFSDGGHILMLQYTMVQWIMSYTIDNLVT